MSTRVGIVLLFVASLGPIIDAGLAAAPAVADVMSVGGGALGAAVTGNAPQPSVSFTNPPDGPGPFAAGPGDLKVADGGTFNGSGMTASSGQVGPLGSHAGGSHSAADVANAAYLVDVITGQNVHSECTSTGAGTSGSVIIGATSFHDNGVSKSFTNYQPAPNTTFTNGFGATLVFNEQTALDAGQTTGIIVNGMHIKSANVDVIVAQSRCTATGPDVVVTPPPTHTTLTVTPSSTGGPAPLTVVYSYKETNDGTHPLAGVTIIDDTCSPVTFVNGDANGNARLDPGETWAYTCSHTFTSPSSYPSTVRVTAVDTVTGESEFEQTETTVEVSTPAVCDLQVVKTMTPTPLIELQPVTVTFTVTNVGAAKCTGDTFAFDVVTASLTPTGGGPTPAGWTCTMGGIIFDVRIYGCSDSADLPPGYSVSFTLTLKVTSQQSLTVDVHNCALVFNLHDTNAANNRSCVTSEIVHPCDLRVSKSMTPTPLVNGDPARIEITVVNLGEQPCPPPGGAGGAVLTDGEPPGLHFTAAGPSPAGWACALGATSFACSGSVGLAGGERVTFTFDAIVTAAGGSKVTNCAILLTSFTDNNPDDNMFCTTSYVIVVLKCDLKIVKEMSPTPLVSGQPAQVKVSLTNVGNGPCAPGFVGPFTTGTIFFDDKPVGLTFTAAPSANQPGWNCSMSQGVACLNQGTTLPPGYAVAFTFPATVDAPAGASVTNCVEVRNGNDVNAANNTPCVTKPVVSSAKCDLKIVKVMSPVPLVSGKPVKVTITVTNVGSGPCNPSAAGTRMIDPRPPGLNYAGTPLAGKTGWICTAGGALGLAGCFTFTVLPVGYTVTFAINATASAPSGSSVKNCATISNQGDLNASNNQACVTVPVVP